MNCNRTRAELITTEILNVITLPFYMDGAALYQGLWVPQKINSLAGVQDSLAFHQVLL